MKLRKSSHLHLYYFIVLYLEGGYAQCTLPAALQNSVWIDSDKGELVFDTSNMTGWDLDYDTNPGAPFEKWECYHTENDDSKIYLVFKYVFFQYCVCKYHFLIPTH